MTGGVPRRVTILTPDGETEVPKRTSTVSEGTLKSAGGLRTLTVVLGAGEIPDTLLDATGAGDCEIVVTYYLEDGDTYTYSGTITDVEARGPYVRVTFRPDS